MTKLNETQNQNTLMAWATGYGAIWAIGIAAGIFIWNSGMLQKVSGKIFTAKKESE